MHTSSDSDDTGYWPGFVAVMSSLVQGLLLLSAAVAAGIVTSNLSEHLKQDLLRNAFAMWRQQAQNPAPEPSPLASGQPAVPTVSSGSAPTPGTEQAKPLPWMLVRFPAETFELDVATRSALVPAVARVRAEVAQAQRLRLAGQVLDNDPLSRRSVYLRVLAVRQTLVLGVQRIPFIRARGQLFQLARLPG